MWLLYAPVQLSAAALCQAISVSHGDKTLDEESIPTEDDILRCCSSLIRLSPSGFELAHFTVKEYFAALDPKKTPHLALYYMPAEQSGLELVLTCLTYINFAEFGRGCVQEHSQWNLLQEKHSFKRYAIAIWQTYFPSQKSDCRLQALMYQLFRTENLGNFLSMVQDDLWAAYGQLVEDPCKEFTLLSYSFATLSPLHYAALMCDYDLCLWLLEGGCAADLVSDFGRPIHWALLSKRYLFSYISFGHQGRYLESLPPSVPGESQSKRSILTSNEMMYSIYISWPPHRYADPSRLDFIITSMLRVIKLLIGHGIDVNSNLPDSQMSILELSARFSPRAMLLFLEAGACLNTRALRALLYYGREYAQEVFNDILGVVSGKNLEKVDAPLFAELLMLSKSNLSKNLNDIPRYVPASNLKAENIEYGLAVLRRAVECSNLESIKTLVRHSGVDINQKFDSDKYKVTGTTVLHLAAAQSSPEIIDFLLECGADPCKATGDGRSPLHFCAYDIEGLNCRLLLQCGSELNVTDDRGWSSWHFASALCNPAMLETLAEQHTGDVGSCISRQSMDGSTPIHVLGQLLDLIQAEQPLIVKSYTERVQKTLELLYKYGADPAIRTEDGSTTLHHWVQRSCFDLKFFDSLLERGVDPLAVRKDKKSAIHLIATRADIFTQHITLLGQMLDHLGSESVLNTLDDFGNSPLHWLCCSFPNDDALWEPIAYEMCVARGADPTLRNKDGKSCFQIALDTVYQNLHDKFPPWKSLEGAAKLLISILDSIPEKDRNMCGAHFKICKFALGLKKDWFIAEVCKRGFDFSANDDPETKQATSNIELACSQITDVALIRPLLDHSQGVNGLQTSGFGLLHHCCSRLHSKGSQENVEVLLAMLDYGLDPNIRSSGRGLTPLMRAAGTGKLLCVKALISHGAYLDMEDSYGWKAVHYACLEGQLSIIRAFHDHCRQISGRLVPVQSYSKDSSDHMNMLQIAAFQRHSEVIDYLLTSKITDKVNERSKFGRTALHFAIRMNDVKSVKILLSYGADQNLFDKDHKNALHWAAKTGNCEIVKILLEGDCDAVAISQSKKSPYDTAVKAGHYEAAEMIEKYLRRTGMQSTLSILLNPLY
jgi:ankyrin repeat protein